MLGQLSEQPHRLRTCEITNPASSLGQYPNCRRPVNPLPARGLRKTLHIVRREALPDGEQLAGLLPGVSQVQ
jgi:hypothetical protein